MQVRILSVFLFLSSSLLISTVICDPNHHYSHHNDFPWQNILSSLGIVVENQTAVSSKEHYTSESTVEILKSETKDGTKIPVVAQNEHYASESTVEGLESETTEGNETLVVAQNEHYASESTVEGLESETTEGNETLVVAQNGTGIRITSSNNSSNDGLGLGFKVGLPILGIFLFICFWYIVCKCCYICCCGCCEEEQPDVVIMQSNTVQTQQPANAGPQIILQQPIIHQQAPPVYDTQQRWAQPPPQGRPQWSQPPQGPPQWAPHPMGQQQHYSPNSGYDNAAFNPAADPPPYNNQKY